MTRARVGWTIAVVDVVAFVTTTLVGPFDASAIVYLVGIASFAGVGALLISRVPTNPIGALLLGAGTTLVAAIVIGTYADIGAGQQPPWPATTLARSLGDLMFLYPFLIAIIGIPLVFPDGRLLSRRYRWVAASAIATAAAWTMGGLFGAPLDWVVLTATLFSFIGTVIAVWRRYRDGDGIARHQVKWLVADVFVAIGAVLPALLLTDVAPDLADAFSSVAIIAMLCLPVVIGIAILRYRLYEIDRLVSRSIAYALLTGGLLMTFLVVNLALTTTLSSITDVDSASVAAATLVVAVLFAPLRRRVQHLVDRRFDRARYDAERTTLAFSTRLRDEVDLPAVTADLDATIRSAIAPTTLAVWLRDAR